MAFHENAIFWIETDKVKPNPFQPRREFDEGKLSSLADSIRQYGVLQPLVVTRKEVYGDDGGMIAEYELIAGERRLRASRLAGVLQIPAVIRSDEEDEQVKLEIAIIENLQREDLNVVDRARAFARLSEEFGYKHRQIGKKIGRSREYVANSVRVLKLPEEMQMALSAGKITEGHTRPLLMLIDRPQEQVTLFKEIMIKKMTVRDAERISRHIAFERVRKFNAVNDVVRPDILEFEEAASESLGRRVQIRKSAVGGKITIDFISDADLREVIETLKSRAENKRNSVEPEKQKEEPAPESKPDESGSNEDDDSFSLSNFSI